MTRQMEVWQRYLLMRLACLTTGAFYDATDMSRRTRKVEQGGAAEKIRVYIAFCPYLSPWRSKDLSEAKAEYGFKRCSYSVLCIN